MKLTLKKEFCCAIIYLVFSYFFNVSIKMDKKKLLKYMLIALELGALGIVIGIACGLVGSAFSHSVAFVTSLRAKHSWILYLLPLGGLLSVFLYRVFKVTNTGTDDAVETAHTDKRVSPLLTPAVFICSVITHLFGGSAGREGAALKMGGGIAAFFSNILKLDERTRRTVALAGMAGVFAAVFGTPLGAAVFCVEVVRSRTVRWWGIITALISSTTAYVVSLLLFVKPERYHIDAFPSRSLDTLWKLLLLSAAGGIVAFIFCTAMHLFSKGAKRILKNDYLRISVIAAIIVLLTFIVGTTDYNGGGINIIEGIFHGHSENVGYESFALKILFTALTVAAGYKGGEIVPAFFTGATFGCAFAPLLGFSGAFGAAIGMTSLFCGVTNCPVATVILATELFGTESLPFSLIAVTMSFLFSGEPSLYDHKKFPFRELKKGL